MDFVNVNTLCRLCLCVSDYLIDVFDRRVDSGFIVKEAIEDLLQFKVAKLNGHPWLACSSCIEKLSDFRLFKRRCTESKIAYENRFHQEMNHVMYDYHDDEDDNKHLVSVKLEKNDVDCVRVLQNVIHSRTGEEDTSDLHSTEDGEKCLMEVKIDAENTENGKDNDIEAREKFLVGDEEKDDIQEANSAVDHVIPPQEEFHHLTTASQDIWPSNVVCVSLANNEGLSFKRFYMDASGSSDSNQDLLKLKNNGHKVFNCSSSHIVVPQRKVNRNRNMTLEQKLRIIERLENGERAASIARELSIPPTTVRSIWQRAGTIKSAVQNIASFGLTKVTRIRSNVMERMENVLALWIEEQNYQDKPLSMKIIMEKARSLHSAIKQGEGESSAEETFTASRGWFQRFKRRSNLHCIRIFGETTEKGAEKFPGVLEAA